MERQVVAGNAPLAPGSPPRASGTAKATAPQPPGRPRAGPAPHEAFHIQRSDTPERGAALPQARLTLLDSPATNMSWSEQSPGGSQTTGWDGRYNTSTSPEPE
jgi:hypothetical protein